MPLAVLSTGIDVTSVDQRGRGYAGTGTRTGYAYIPAYTPALYIVVNVC